MFAAIIYGAITPSLMLIALLWQMNIEPPKMQWFWNNPRELKKTSSLKT
jgi:hypothetical protein